VVAIHLNKLLSVWQSGIKLLFLRVLALNLLGVEGSLGLLETLLALQVLGALDGKTGALRENVLGRVGASLPHA
jgi:hypothetical protein